MNGKNYIRKRPKQINDQKSPAQLAQRQRMQTVISFLQKFSDPIRFTFASEAAGRTAWQAAQSYNLRHGLTGDYPDIRIDYSKALLSRGPLPLPESCSVALHPEGFLVQWVNGPEADGKHSGDFLMVIILLPGVTVCNYLLTDTRRSAGQYVWKTNRPMTQDTLPDVWIAFRNVRMTKWSDSLWVQQ
jgi:hypothetical protein